MQAYLSFGNIFEDTKFQLEEQTGVFGEGANRDLKEAVVPVP